MLKTKSIQEIYSKEINSFKGGREIVNNLYKKSEKVDDAIKLDLNKLLLLKLKSLWYVIVIGILIGSLSGILYYSVLSKPKYEAKSMIYLRSSSSKKLSLESLQLSTSLTQDYQIIFTSRPNLESIIKKLKLHYSVDQLKNMLTINNPDETRILEITVKSKDAVEAKNIANAVIDFGMEDVREIESQEPFVIQRAVVNSHRIGLSLPYITIICGFSGMIISITGIVLKFVLNDSFTSSDDVENTLGVPVLAVIAEDQSLTYAKLESSNSRRRKHHGKKTSK